MDIISVSHLTKLYKKYQAVTDVSFSMPEKSVYGLIGLNGAGKTTTIKSITGLLKNFEGSISVAGQPWGSKTYNSNFVFLPELFTPPAYLTGLEYIIFMQKLHNAEVDMDFLIALCDELNFDRGYLGKKTKTYSKGTMQKLGLIQAICSPCELIILDEPMSGLDPLARARFKTVIEKAYKNGRSVLLSTHILHDIDTMCTHVGILNSGRLIYNGTPEDLKKKNDTQDIEEAFLKEIKI